MRPIPFRTTVHIVGQPVETEFEGFATGTPGLIIVPPQPGDEVNRFALVHFRSGSIVASRFSSPEAALEVANRIGPLADWTKSAMEMQEYARNREWALYISDTARRYGGWAGNGPKDDDKVSNIDNGLAA